jgi:hypothetical protein
MVSNGEEQERKNRKLRVKVLERKRFVKDEKKEMNYQIRMMRTRGKR